VNAPMLQVTSSIDDDYFEDLNYDTTREILQKLKHGEKPRPGPQSGRISSEPQGGKTTLKEPANARG